MARAQPEHTPMDESDLRPADEAILDVLQEGRATKGMLVDESGYSRNTVYNRLEVLQAADHVELVHESTRLFELVNDPRDAFVTAHPAIRAWLHGENREPATVATIIKQIADYLDDQDVPREVTDAVVWQLIKESHADDGSASGGYDKLTNQANKVLEDRGIELTISTDDIFEKIE